MLQSADDYFHTIIISLRSGSTKILIYGFAEIDTFTTKKQVLFRRTRFYILPLKRRRRLPKHFHYLPHVEKEHRYKSENENHGNDLDMDTFHLK